MNKSGILMSLLATAGSISVGTEAAVVFQSPYLSDLSLSARFDLKELRGFCPEAVRGRRVAVGNEAGISAV